MKLPILNVSRRKFFVTDDEEILGVTLLSCLGKVERARNHDFIVDDHHLVVGNGMSGVDFRRNAGVDEEVGGRIFLRFLALVQQHLNFDSLRCAFARASAFGAQVKEYASTRMDDFAMTSKYTQPASLLFLPLAGWRNVGEK